MGEEIFTLDLENGQKLNRQFRGNRGFLSKGKWAIMLR